MVDFADSPEQKHFRDSVEEFFADNFPTALQMSQNEDPRTARTMPTSPEKESALKEWRAALVKKGWIAPAWPKTYGGADLSTMEQFILNETIAIRGAPRVGVPDVGSTIMVHGNDEQKKEPIDT